MASPHHRPASRERYAAQHPALTVHFDKDTYARVIELRERSGLSLNQLVRQALGSLEEHVAAIEETAYLRGHDKDMDIGYGAGERNGIADAKAKYCLIVPCAVCAEPTEILANAPIAVRAVELLSAQGWSHKACIEERRLAGIEPPAPLSGPQRWVADYEAERARTQGFTDPRRP